MTREYAGLMRAAETQGTNPVVDARSIYASGARGSRARMKASQSGTVKITWLSATASPCVVAR